MPAKKAALQETPNGLQQAMIALVQSHATLEQAMSSLIQTQALMMESSVRMQKEFGEIKAILYRHEQILEGLTEAIRQKIGFAPPEPRPGGSGPRKGR